MILTIKSVKLGKTITFSRPGTAYIYADINGKSGTLGMQICSKSGSTLTCEGDSPEDEARFEAICRRWYRGYVKNEFI